MPLSAKIREQLISGFRTELAEHIQTLNTGLLAIEEKRVADDQRSSTLGDIFRAAHSLKGAARAVGVTAVEQIAHALEDVLSALQRDELEATPKMFTACYRACDAILVVQAAYEAGETTPPTQALQALADLDPFRMQHKAARQRASAENESEPEPEEAVAVLEESAARAQSAAAVRPEPVVPIRPEPAALVRPEPPAPNGPGGNGPGGNGSGGSASNDSAAPTAVVNPAPGGDETIRVSVSKLDALMAQLSELLVTKIRAEQRLAQVRQAQSSVAEWQKDWFSFRSAYSRLARQVHDATSVVSVDMQTGSVSKRSEDDKLARPKRALLSDGRLEKELLRLINYVDVSQERLRNINGQLNTLSREYENDTMYTALVIDALEQDIKRVRMLPLSTITASFGRMVRDLSQTAGKEVRLEVVGGEVELDKRVLEQIKDPLIHLLRNAIDHGLETPEQRQALGKPCSGTITLKAEQLGKDVVVSIADDGHGLDLEAIRRVAIHRRHLQQETQVLTDQELADLIFNSGFSTSPIITDVSGRGLGLDIVRRNIEALSGHINVKWQRGAGSTFAFTIPLAVTLSRGLLVRTADQLFAIPLNAVERILQVKPNQIVPLGGHDTVQYEGRSLTLVRLDDVLELPHAIRAKGEQSNNHVLIVILAVADRRMAFTVDELVSEQEVVIKALGKQLVRVGGIAGATVMGNGEVTLILNVADLLRLAVRGEARSVLEATPEVAATGDNHSKTRILVVDDSVTTRTLEKNILEAAGYSVQIAIDGQDAWNSMSSASVPDLVISDIAMPRMDGFDLTRRIKGDTRTLKVPVILVTSLDSVEDKSRGISAGADAYIIKGRFDQNNLLETIEQLI
jgi:two-component system chemotaxis sensor kinase CheA